MIEFINEFFYLIKHKNRWGAFCVLHYRLAHYFSFGWRRYVGFLFVFYYHILFRHIIGFDVHEKSSIGYNFCPWHCFGIAVNPNVVIGDNLTLGHNVTIGEKNGKSPIIGNNVIISPSSNLIGGITIGDNVVIGIGSVVLKDLPSNCIVAGNPATILKFK